MGIEIYKSGVNKQIKYNLLSDKKMRKVGFDDIVENKWTWFKMLKGGISFNVSIPKDGNDDEFRIDVLDENFCQPYDYQYILQEYPDHAFGLCVKEEVEYCIQHLQDKGVLSGHTRGGYI